MSETKIFHSMDARQQCRDCGMKRKHKSKDECIAAFGISSRICNSAG